MIRSALVFLLVLLVSRPASSQPAQSSSPTAEYKAYQELLDWLLRDGGRWEAKNPAHDSTADGSPKSFGYTFSKGWGSDVLRLRITGRVGEQNYLYWDGFYYWHPVRNRLVYVSQGTGGAIASGESIDAAGTLVFEVISPTTAVSVHMDEDVRLTDDAFESHSYERTTEGWAPKQILTWRRVRE